MPISMEKAHEGERAGGSDPAWQCDCPTFSRRAPVAVAEFRHQPGSVMDIQARKQPPMTARRRNRWPEQKASQRCGKECRLGQSCATLPDRALGRLRTSEGRQEAAFEDARVIVLIGRRGLD